MVFNSCAVNFVTLSDQCSCDADRKVSPASNQADFFAVETGWVSILSDSGHRVVCRRRIGLGSTRTVVFRIVELIKLFGYFFDRSPKFWKLGSHCLNLHFCSCRSCGNSKNPLVTFNIVHQARISHRLKHVSRCSSGRPSQLALP